MVKTVERIEQEIAVLQQAVAAIAQEFHDTYSQYLTVLGQAVRQQLILASYHVCTNGYPEQFLELSLAQRQDLQRALRQLAKQAQTQLIERLQAVDAPLPDTDAFLESEASELESAAEREDAEELQETAEEPLDTAEPVSQPEISQLEVDPADDSVDASSPEPSELQAIAEDLENREAENEDDEDEDDEDEDDEANQPITPRDLARWQQHLEEAITETLQTVSHAANRLLQQADILPNRLPEPVLEVAAKADLASETATTPPNLLNLLIETESEDDKETAMTQVIAIRLRLSEIEFSDPAATVWRSKIRNLGAQLNKLGREYQKKQRERAIAQAETAWRSSWYED